MSDRITITLDKEIFDFLESKAKGNRSAYINSILKAEKQRIIAEQIFTAKSQSLCPGKIEATTTVLEPRFTISD